MRLLVTGASGLIGSSLVPWLASGGYRVTRLTRSEPQPGADEVRWDPAAGTIDRARLEGVEAVVHLAGENLATGRWTHAKKARIQMSRVSGTRLLSEALARLTRPPRVFVCASAIGYYGNRGAEILNEESPPGSGFLADVCREWEAAAEPARRRGIRVVHLRTGVVLSAQGGALAKILLPFRMGLGGPLGNGQQAMSWIALDDVLGVIQHVLSIDAVTGPLNVVAPTPVTNREFTKTLGRVLSRPTLVPAPAFALRLILGELADEALLASTRAIPSKLLATGYVFRYPTLEGALRHVLQKP